MNAKQALKRIRVAPVLVNNEPNMYGVFDTWDNRDHFNGRLLNLVPTAKDANAIRKATIRVALGMSSGL